MAACPKTNVGASALAANSAAGDSVFMGRGPSPDQYVIRKTMDARRLMADHLNAAASLSAQLPSSPDVGTLKMDYATGKLVQRLAGSAVGELQKLEPYGTGQMVDEMNAAMRLAYGTTVSSVGRAFRYATQFAYRHLDRNARLGAWGVHYAGDNSQLAKQSWFYKAIDEMGAVINGRSVETNRWFRQLSDAAVPYADRTGLSVDAVLSLIGDYAVDRHTPERNTHLLSAWQGEAVRLTSEMLAAYRNGDLETSRKLQEQIRKYNRWYGKLVSNLDNDSPHPDARVTWTNAQARVRMAKTLGTLKMTEQEAAPLADMMSAIAERILERRVRDGFVSREMLQAFPEFEHYVPMFARRDLVTSLAGDTGVFDLGSYRAAEGLHGEIPESAYITLLSYADRSAREAGVQKLGHALYAIASKQMSDGVDRGIRVADYGETMKARNVRNDPEAGRILQEGGIVYTVVGGDGQRSKKILYFDHGFSDPDLGLTHTELNHDLAGVAENYDVLRSAARVTGFFGQLSTHFTPLFSPLNFKRDTLERTTHIVTRQYVGENGEIVEGSSLVAKYVTNTPRAARMLYDAISGRAPEDSATARYFNEFVHGGMLQDFAPGRSKRGDIAELHRRVDDIHRQAQNDPKVREVLGIVKGARDGGKAVMSTLQNWNDYWNNIAGFNHYVTLREAGVSAREASVGVLEMMNMSKSGAHTPFLRVLYPFVTPTMQGGAAMLRTLGFAPSGNGQFEFRTTPKGALMMTVMTMALGTLGALSRDAFGNDATGQSKFDELPLSEVSKAFLIPFGDGDSYMKLTYGFGPMQMAATLGIGWDRVQRGIMSPGDLVFETLFAAARNIAPGNWPTFSAMNNPGTWLVHMFSPTVFLPLVENATNMNRFGRTIRNPSASDAEPKALQGKLGTEPPYRQAAKWIYEKFGLDFAPEELKNFVRGLFAGPLRVVSTALLENERYERGSETTHSDLGPILTAMGGTLYYGRQHEAARARFYRERDSLFARIRRESIPWRTKDVPGDFEDKLQWRLGKLLDAGFNIAELERAEKILRIEHELNSRDSAFRDEIKPVIDSAATSDEVRDAFRRYEADKTAIFETLQ